jgi:UDP-N-acetylmuramate dehydrogenase
MDLSLPIHGLLSNEPMSRHTSWRVGGPADAFFRPDSIETLQEFLQSLPADSALYWVGLGSNLLVRDGGVRGAVICTLDLSAEIERVDSTAVRVGAGVPCTIFARQCVRWKLGPAAFFAGIPGTIGGALAMNAGAFGGETWERVKSVETIDRSGACRVRTPTEFDVGYRSVSGTPAEWFVGATFEFAVDELANMDEITATLKNRSNSQPIGKLSCGSVFRNPKGQFAAQLIEQAGLKGASCGDAIVSEKHANFVINRGSATASDIETLIETMLIQVERDSGIRLELEVKIIGEKAL